MAKILSFFEAAGLTSNTRPMLHPFSRFRLVYEFILVVTTLVSAFAVPVIVAWAPVLGDSWRAFLLALSVFFMLDCLLHFRLGYVISYTGVVWRAKRSLHSTAFVEMDPHKVARHYLTTWFLPDFIGSLPYNLIGWYTDSAVMGLEFLVLLRLFKFFVFCHTIACVFFWVARLQPFNKDGAWIYYFQVVDEDAVAVLVSEASVWRQYITSFFYAAWTVQHTASGSIYPGKNREDRIWCIFQVLVGQAFLQYLTVNIVNWVLVQDAKNRRALVQGYAFQSFFDKQANVPDWLTQRIISHFDRKWRTREREVLQAEISDTLPRHFRLEMSVEWWLGKVKPTQLLPHDRGFLRALLAHAVRHEIPPYETILEQGSRHGMDHLYIVISGTVECTREPGMGSGQRPRDKASSEERKELPSRDELVKVDTGEIATAEEGRPATRTSAWVHGAMEEEPQKRSLAGLFSVPDVSSEIARSQRRRANSLDFVKEEAGQIALVRAGRGSMARGESCGSKRASDDSATHVEMWEVAEGGLLGDACLYDLVASLDVDHPFAPQLQDWVTKNRPRSLFTAHTLTPVRLAVLKLEDVLETMDSFSLLFVPIIRAMQGTS
eukprot:jgi/Mesvir1/4787/Mv11087-RA.1